MTPEREKQLREFFAMQAAESMIGGQFANRCLKNGRELLDLVDSLRAELAAARAAGFEEAKGAMLACCNGVADSARTSFAWIRSQIRQLKPKPAGEEAEEVKGE